MASRGRRSPRALARRGIEVVILERSPAWGWRAGGVFASPAAVSALAAAGLGQDMLGRVARPIPAMRLETPGGAVVRLTYGADRGGPPAVGFDRARLDPALLDLAVAAGATVRRGAGVTRVELDGGGGRTRGRPAVTRLRARIVVGADGAQSVVARAAGVARPCGSPRVSA